MEVLDGDVSKPRNRIIRFPSQDNKIDVIKPHIKWRFRHKTIRRIDASRVEQAVQESKAFASAGDSVHSGFSADLSFRPARTAVGRTNLGNGDHGSHWGPNHKGRLSDHAPAAARPRIRIHVFVRPRPEGARVLLPLVGGRHSPYAVFADEAPAQPGRAFRSSSLRDVWVMALPRDSDGMPQMPRTSAVPSPE